MLWHVLHCSYGFKSNHGTIQAQFQMEESDTQNLSIFAHWTLLDLKYCNINAISKINGIGKKKHFVFWQFKTFTKQTIYKHEILIWGKSMHIVTLFKLMTGNWKNNKITVLNTPHLQMDEMQITLSSFFFFLNSKPFH